MAGVFVAGTDTDVGKTHVAAAIARTLMQSGEQVSAYKPVVSGVAHPPADHELLASVTGQYPSEISPIAYEPAVSPHLAAELAGDTIDIGDLVDRGKALPGTLVVEGIGGLLVPITYDFSARDLAIAFGLPLVVVARPGLGTINHSLLTLESARRAGLEVRAVVITPWPQQPSTMEQSNRKTIERLAELPVHTLEETRFGAPVDLPVGDWIG